MAITHINKTLTQSVSTEICAANAARSYALIQNDSDTAVYLAFGTAAVANTGVRINANGGSYEMSRSVNNLTGLAINGFVAAASKVICGIEVS